MCMLASNKKIKKRLVGNDVTLMHTVVDVILGMISSVFLFFVCSSFFDITMWEGVLFDKHSMASVSTKKSSQKKIFSTPQTLSSILHLEC